MNKDDFEAFRVSLFLSKISHTLKNLSLPLKIV